MKRVLILVLSADPGYAHMVQAIRDTWGRNTAAGTRLLYYYGRRNGYPAPDTGKVLRQDDTMICDVQESLQSVLRKTLMAYAEVLANEEFDYIFRCCCGSYVDTSQLIRFIEDKPLERFYCGAPLSHDGYPYASGAGYFLSRDLVRLIVEQQDEIHRFKFPGHIDDVAVGRLMHQSGVPIHPGAVKAENETSIRPGCYHYHIRAMPRYMYELHESASRYSKDALRGRAGPALES